MKKNILYCVPVVILGALIAFGPQYLFTLCGGNCSCCGDIPTCYWAGRAEIAMGLVIAALGLCLIVFTDPKTQLGLVIGIFLTGLIALLIPHVLIGGCETQTMACHRRAFPALTVESVILLVFSVFLLISSGKKKAPATAAQ